MRTPVSVLSALVLCAACLATLSVGAQPQSPDARERVDYLTFAQGAVPVRIAGATATLGVGMDKAVAAIDGNPGTYVLSQKGVTKDADTEFIYRLPAATTFDRFAVPNVLETPSPSQTFARVVEVHGSSESADAGFELLASATLTTHRSAGLIDLPGFFGPVITGERPPQSLLLNSRF